ncbi:la-related protein 7 [Phlebotomus argentipes]|uniref:la-related protein 7 n=1 Tax=Phlebotomus argentipes TaxID=94469 RepID=UPI0028930A3B|nr:la-related protein 7 [Phlebotomus argentipes]
MEEEKSNTTKRARSRKKLMYNNIRKQMEFYFSDANITKDRFLGQLVNEDPYVPLEIFLSFNRMKQLTECAKDIAKALAKSQMLQLSEDEKKVRRRTKINWKINSDECTIYVEGLPAKADHEWMKTTFGGYGSVVYVSLPKYSATKRIKQFGFVEFDGTSAVEKTLKAFQKFGGVLSSEMDPAVLQSVVSFNQEQQEKPQEEGKDALKADEETEESGEEERSEPPAKRLKVEQCEAEEKTKKEDTEPESAQEEEKADDAVATDERKTHRRKRHKSKKNSSAERDSIFDLKIMTKKEWKRLRNKYLNLQRERFKEAKVALQGFNGHRNVAKSPTLTLSKSPGSMNFYGESKPAPSTGISMTKGVIVEVKLAEALVDVKDFKAELRQYEFVKYVDVKEGSILAYIRVDTPESAEDLVKRYTDPERVASILSGDAEELYWRKIADDRDAKIKKVVKVEKPKRGREKIKKKINQHIFFGQDEDKE